MHIKCDKIAVKLFIVIVGMYTFSKSYSQEQEPFANGVRYSAERMSYETHTQGAIRYLYDNVKLIQEDIIVTCDEAQQVFYEKKSILKGNVVLRQKNMTLKAPYIEFDHISKIAYAKGGNILNDGKTTLTADRSVYYTQSKTSEFFGDVIVEEDSVIIFSDKLFYNRNNKNSKNYGNVYIEGKYNGSHLVCDSLFHFPNEGKTYAMGNPKLMKIDKKNSLDTLGGSDFDTMYVRSKEIISERETNHEIYFFFGDSEIFTKNVTAKADTTTFLRTEEKIILRGNPIVWYDSTQLWGDSVDIYLDSNRLKSIYSFNNAFSASKIDSVNLDRINQLAGDKIEIQFDEGKLNSILTEGKAKSIYFMIEDENPDGASRSASDSIRIVFENGEPQGIYWLGDTNGEFIPEEYIETNVESYYLSGFKKNLYKPEKPVFEFRKKY